MQTLQTSRLQLLGTWNELDEDGVDDHFDSTLGVDGQIDDKVDGTVEDEKEVGDLDQQVDHICFQIFHFIACRKSKIFRF